MRRGRVYVWMPEPDRALGGSVLQAVVPLLRLDDDPAGSTRLHGRHVRVRNGGAVNVPDPVTGAARAMPIGDAEPDAEGDFLFEPGRGGGRMDKVLLGDPDFRWRYIQASRFGEVNSYFHLDRIAAYVDELLRELGAPSLPPVTAVVNAHHAATQQDGACDGVRRSKGLLPFQGGHYRLPSKRYDIREPEPLSLDGEIHLGPGWRLLEDGALVAAAGGRYRANASHNAGILYHEYGHHITRHTADFEANGLRPPDRQKNRKAAIDEGTCDYFCAAMLGTPHIWAWHRRHDEVEVHPRSLSSKKTMADRDLGDGADEHANGTIWAAALWDLRTRLSVSGSNGGRRADLLVLKALLLLGKAVRHSGKAIVKLLRQVQQGFGLGLGALLQADEALHGGRHRELLLGTFAARGIGPDAGLGAGGEP